MNRSALYATELADGYAALLTLSYTGGTIRVTDWGDDLVSDGQTYRAQAFAVTLPSLGDEAPPRARIRVDNASLEFVVAIRSVSEVLDAELSIVAASAPNTIEIGPYSFECRVGRYDAGTVELDLTYEPLLDLAVPHHLFGPGWFPGLFR